MTAQKESKYVAHLGKVKQCIPKGPIWNTGISQEPYKNQFNFTGKKAGFGGKKFPCSKQALMARTECMAWNKPICR
jgi:hypothetical protein